jgi:Fe2+ or Zn2+ uptake regulation protein
VSSILDGGVREKFRKSGYVLTAQRWTVLWALREANGHISVEDIYLVVKEDNPRVALGTVYQALSVLRDRSDRGQTLA